MVEKEINSFREFIDELMKLIASDAGFMDTVQEFGKLGFNAVNALVLGGVVLATPFTVAAYYILLKFFRNIDTKRAEKIARQNTREQFARYQENTETE